MEDDRGPQRRMGLRKRIAARRPLVEPKPLAGLLHASELVDICAEEFALGFLSGPLFQKVCKGAQTDGLDNDAVAAIALAGTSGKYPGNTHRDIMHKLTGDVTIPETHHIRVTMKGSDGKVGKMLHPVLYPDQLAWALRHEFPHAFPDLSGSLRVEEFWTAQKPDAPKIEEHPMTGRPGWQQRALPVEVFGDAAVYTGATGLYAIVWSFKLSRGSPWATKLVFTVIPKIVCVKDANGDTLAELWEHFAKSLLALWFGRHPHQDSAGLSWPVGSLGERLAGNTVFPEEFFCVVWDVLGDLEHHANVLRMPHWSNPEPCWLCRGNRTNRNWADWRKTAAWKRTLVTSAQARAAPSRRHPFFQVLGVTGLHDLFVKPGNMHTLEGGVLLYFHGGVLMSLVQAPTTSIRGASQAARLDRVWARIQHHYKAMEIPHRLRNLTLTKFKPSSGDDFPMLKSKCAPSKDLVFAMAAVCADFSSGSEFDYHRCSAYQCMAEFFRLCQSSGWVPSDEAAAKMEAKMEEFLVHYHWLAVSEARQGRSTFNETFKFHLGAHISMQARYENPVRTTEYGYEDSMGRISRVGRSSANGLPNVRVAFKAMAKIRLAIKMMWARAR